MSSHYLARFGGEKLIADQTLKVTIETKKRLDSIKIHPRETIDDLINRLFRFRDWMAKMKKDNNAEAPVETLRDSWAELKELWEYL